MSSMRRTVASKVAGIILGLSLGASGAFAANWFWDLGSIGSRTADFTRADGDDQAPMSVTFRKGDNNGGAVLTASDKKLVEGGDALDVYVDLKSDVVLSTGEAAQNFIVCDTGTTGAVTITGPRTIAIAAGAKRGGTALTITPSAKDNDFQRAKAFSLVVKEGSVCS